MESRVENVVWQYAPAHYRNWADLLRERQGYDSILSQWLSTLAGAYEHDRSAHLRRLRREADLREQMAAHADLPPGDRI